jgi:hypothetical protein
MNNQYVNLSPQQRMAQALQMQEQQQGLQQGMQQSMPQQSNPFESMPSMMQMYMRNKQMQGMPQTPQAPQGYMPQTGMQYGD